LFRSPLLRAVRCCRVYGIAYSPPRLSETKGFSSDGGKSIAWKRNNNKDTFSGGNLCCWVRDGRENFSENLVHDAIARCVVSYKNRMGHSTPFTPANCPENRPTLLHFQSAFGCKRRKLLQTKNTLLIANFFSFFKPSGNKKYWEIKKWGLINKKSVN
jgi:hypothetical protein